MNDNIKRFLSFAVVGAIFIGQGVAPANATNKTQAQMMARRAAFVDVQRQSCGQGNVKILEEVFDGHVYKITAEID